MSYSALPLAVVTDALTATCDMGGPAPSKTAERFVAAFREAGGELARLPKPLLIARDAALRSTLAFIRENDLPLWTEEGDPTWEHLELVHLGYSPGPKRLLDWLDWLDEQDVTE